MAREHHCPKCAAQPCNASTSKIHTCGVCASIWEEDLSAPAPAAPAPPAPALIPPGGAAPKPAGPVTSAPKPATPTPTPPTVPKPTAPVAAAPSPALSPKPVPAPAPSAAPRPPTEKPVAPGGTRALADVLPGAKVKRCPACTSDGLAQPSDFTTVQGRLVLVDSQTYRGHRWYADTGELLPAVPPPAPALTPSAPAFQTRPAT